MCNQGVHSIIVKLINNSVYPDNLQNVSSISKHLSTGNLTFNTLLFLHWKIVSTSESHKSNSKVQANLN